MLFLHFLSPAIVEPTIDLHSLLNLAYERAGYGVVVDYSREPVPALSEADAAWVDTLLRKRFLQMMWCVEARRSSSGKGISLANLTLLKFSE